MKTIVIVMVAGLMMLFLLAVVGVGAYFLGSKNILSKFLPTPTAVPTQALVGNDRDAHGCIPSAGYQWCESKQKCLRPFAETCETPTGTVRQNAPTSAPTVDETQTLIAVIKQALVAKHGSTANELTITVSKIEGDFAKGMTSASGGGGIWFAAKTNGVWKLVWDGNGQINCSDLTPYPGFPNTLIPDCYDTTTGQVVTR